MFTLTELFSQEQFLPHPPGPFKLYLGVFTLTDFKNQMHPFQSSKQLLACALSAAYIAQEKQYCMFAIIVVIVKTMFRF
jgi:hypothetical protein